MAQVTLNVNAIAYKDADGRHRYADQGDGIIDIPDEEYERLGPKHEKEYGYAAVVKASRAERKAAEASEEESRSPAAPAASLDPDAEGELMRLSVPRLLELATENGVEVEPGARKPDLARKLAEAGVKAS